LPEVRTIAVIGAGTGGRGIAQLAALAGYRTILEDLLPNALRRAESEIRLGVSRAAALAGFSAGSADTAIARLEFAGTVEEAARSADLVIESVPEEMESKLEIFTLLDKICRPGTILASNTFLFSISEIARVTYRARNCLGMRFATPAGVERRLEIVRGIETDDETVAAAVEVGRRIGREVTVTQDSATWQE
jgi:3-hydroxybutyryl-CoA dehydrogenase